MDHVLQNCRNAFDYSRRLCRVTSREVEVLLTVSLSSSTRSLIQMSTSKKLIQILESRKLNQQDEMVFKITAPPPNLMPPRLTSFWNMREFS